MNKPKVVSISHKIDPDGIGAQAIIFRYFRELKIEPIGLLADYYDFEITLEKAIDLKPSILIISDIGVNKSYLYNVVEKLRKLEARKIWIDHHKITNEDRQLLESTVDEFIHDTKVCAAELVQKRFMPNDEISKKIAKISHNGDFDIEDRIADIFYTLIDYNRNSLEKLESIRDLFIQGELDQANLMEKYLEAYKVFEAERDRIRKTKELISIAGKNVLVAESAILPRGKVTKFLSEIEDQDIYLAIDTTNFRIGLRSKTCDVATIARFFGGGGHKHRSGFTFREALNSEGKLSELFLTELTKALE